MLFRNNLLKILISTTLCFNMLAVDALEQTKKTIFLQKAKKIAKITGKIAVGVGLACVGHIACELISTYIHECGHATGYFFMEGKKSSIRVYPTNHINIFGRICQPVYGGCDRFVCSSKSSELISVSAGPACGLLATYSQLVALEVVQARLAKQPAKKAFNNGLKLPVTFFKNFALKVRLLLDSGEDSTEISCAEVFFGMMAFFRCSRIVGEALYGFTPYNVPQSEGDGVKMWKLLRNKEDISTINQNLIVAALIPTVSALLIGLSMGLYSRLKDSGFRLKIKNAARKVLQRISNKTNKQASTDTKV